MIKFSKGFLTFEIILVPLLAACLMSLMIERFLSLAALARRKFYKIKAVRTKRTSRFQVTGSVAGCKHIN
jgi:hypothetical protein